MSLFFISLSILLASSVLTLVTQKGRRFFACLGTFAGSAVGFVFSLQSLLSPAKGYVDPLSAFFLIAIFALSLVVSLYAWGYIKHQPLLHRSLPFFPLLVASMAAVVTAQDGFLFLICWEVMSLASFFLVITEHELREVRHAGWVTLVATHLATAFLIAFFVVLQEKTGSFLFQDWTRIAPLSPLLSGSLFLFAFIGFGTKAGIFPFHVWLPHAHPAAPSYVSALMSGVMIKTGIYGLLRAITFLGLPPLWWGELLIVMGVLSAVIGILYAHVQQDLKRMLAYSSVENIGIITIGMGLGLIGITTGQDTLVLLGFGGGLLHIWNHALFKGLLFMGAGSVLHTTHTRVIENLGGLLKKMPVTGSTFLIGAAAICGLPPLNGFISEFLIYLGLFQGIWNLNGLPLALSVVGIVGIAFAGGLALACFTKIFGIVFLGEARTTKAKTALEAPRSLRISLVVLSTLCLLGGIFPLLVWPLLSPVISSLSPSLKMDWQKILEVSTWLNPVIQASLLLLVLGFASQFMGRFLRRGRKTQKAPTWDCGYANPSPRMQYTASSFSQPLAIFFRALFKPHVQWTKLKGPFPSATRFSVHIADYAERLLFEPVFQYTNTLLRWVRKIQKDQIQNQLALIFYTLLALLLWEVWFGI